jgi:thymidine phosphorylase
VPLTRAPEVEVLTAPADGVLQELDAMAVGVAAWRLGAGRARKDHPVSAGAGVVWHATVGDRVIAGQPLLELHTDDAARLPRALAALEDGWSVGSEPASPPELVIERVAASGRG